MIACSMCSEVKAVEAFYVEKRDRASKGRPRMPCRACTVAVNAKNRFSRSKECPGCGVVKCVGDFHSRSDSPLSSHRNCKTCHNKNQKAPGWWRKFSGRTANQHLLRSYGITSEQKAQILVSQGGICALCGSDSPGSKLGWHVDHDHATGRVRGILCKMCNTGLGIFGDSADRLRRAIEYLGEPCLTSERPPQET